MSSASAPCSGNIFQARWGLFRRACSLSLLQNRRRAVLRKAKQEETKGIYLTEACQVAAACFMSHNPFLVLLGGKPLDLPRSLTKVL